MTPFAEVPTILLSTSTYSILHLLLPNLLSHLTNLPHLPNKPLTLRDHALLSSKLLGGLHSLLSSTLALRLVTDPRWKEVDLIATPSRFGDRIVALELGYLISDIAALLAMKKTLRDGRLVRRVVGHHLVVGGLMGWYLSAAARGKAKGTFFVASYMIMNLSTPLRYLTWYLRRYTSTSRSITSAVHAMSMAVYAAVRLGLLYYQLWVYGQRKGLSALGAYKTLPTVCRVSTVLLLVGNGIRFGQLSGIANSRRKRG